MKECVQGRLRRPPTVVWRRRRPSPGPRSVRAATSHTPDPPGSAAQTRLRYPHVEHATVHCQERSARANRAPPVALSRRSRSRGANLLVQSQALLQEGKIFLGRSVAPEYLELKLANRHGLVTGATGTGKTVSLQVLAEGFSDAGVPVFAADIKGDLAGISAVGEQERGLVKRADDIGLDDWANTAYPTVFWDLFGEQGHPCAPPCRTWGRCCSPACWSSTRRRRACSNPVPRGGRRGHAAARPQGPARHGQ